MRNTMLTLLGAAIVSTAFVSDASAAGRESILARLSNPFGTARFSRFTASPYGLPALRVDDPFASVEPVAAPPIPLIAVEGVDQPFVPVEEPAEAVEVTTTLTPLSSVSPRPPYRPRVRSPFRPPPRPSF